MVKIIPISVSVPAYFPLYLTLRLELSDTKTNPCESERARRESTPADLPNISTEIIAFVREVNSPTAPEEKRYPSLYQQRPVSHPNAN